MKFRSLLALSLAASGCAVEAGTVVDDELAVAPDKADTTEPVLTCTGVRRDEVRSRGAIEIFDLGPAMDVPEELPWTIESVISDGFDVRQYRITAEIKIGRRAYEKIDELYYGNLYQGGGVVVSENDTVYEVSNDDDGPRMTVRIDDSPATDVGLQLACEGTLPTEDEARGPDPLGLSLRFDCATEAVDAMEATTFTFGLIRIDRPASIGMMDGENEDGESTPVTVDDSSPVFSLNENWGLRRTQRSIYITGDSDGFAYSKLRISVPREVGQEATGTFTYEADGEDELRAPVKCTTRAPE